MNKKEQRHRLEQMVLTANTLKWRLKQSALWAEELETFLRELYEQEEEAQELAERIEGNYVEAKPRPAGAGEEDASRSDRARPACIGSQKSEG